MCVRIKTICYEWIESLRYIIWAFVIYQWPNQFEDLIYEHRHIATIQVICAVIRRKKNVFTYIPRTCLSPWLVFSDYYTDSKDQFVIRYKEFTNIWYTLWVFSTSTIPILSKVADKQNVLKSKQNKWFRNFHFKCWQT